VDEVQQCVRQQQQQQVAGYGLAELCMLLHQLQQLTSSVKHC
jgi:hypothetical protein